MLRAPNRRPNKPLLPITRHSLRMRLLLTVQPARRAILAARRHPQRGRSVENFRSQARSSASSLLIGGGADRIVDR
jgi:hypothetical protein